MAASPSTPAPGPSSPRLVPAPDRPPRSKGPIYFFVILLIGGAAWFFRPRHEKPGRTATLPTVKAVRGAVVATRRLAGSITAGRFANITIPKLQAPDTGRGLTLTYIVPSGSMVKEGDLLAEIDAQDMRDHLDDVEAMVNQAALDIKKKKTVQIAQMEALRQKLRSARANLLKAREDLKALDVLSVISQEQAKLSEEEYQATYNELSQEIPLEEKSLQADLNVSNLAYEQQVRHRDRHRNDVARCRILSPMSGMVVLKTTTRNGELTQVQVGERVYSGQAFLRVVDLKSMELDATMNQSEAELIHLGQPATLRFDAFPDIVLSGKVEAVGSMAVGGRRQNYYVRSIPVRVAIEGRDARVIPDLSASADVQTSAAEGLVVPRQAVVEDAGEPVVYVRQNGAFARRGVEIAAENNTKVVVAGGVKEGEEIALDARSVTLP